MPSSLATSASFLKRRHFLTAGLASLSAVAISPARAEESSSANDKKENFRSPFIYPFHIGEVEAWSISDAGLQLGEGLDLMWPVEERPKMTEILEVHGEKTKPLPLFVNVLVLRKGQEVILFDAGFGQHDNPRLGWLMDGLAQIGIKPEDVTAGFLSHAHSDHLNGFVAGEKSAFPNMAFHLLPAELDFWRGQDPDFSKSKRNKKPIPNMIADVRKNFDILEPQTVLLKPQQELFDGLVTVEPAPGHTDGHTCFRIRSGDDELLHLMDLAHHHLLMFADPNWTIAFDHDPITAVETRKKFWREAAAKRTRCFGFHLPWPGLGRIIPEKTGYRWWAESWQWPSE